jgi:hypothetical protein
VNASVGDLLTAPQGTDQLYRLGHLGPAELIVRPLAGRGILVQRFARSYTEKSTVRSHTSDRRRSLSDDRRMIPQRGTGNARAQNDFARLGGRRSEPSPYKACLALFAPRMEMITHIDAIETGLLGGYCVVEKVARRIFAPSPLSNLNVT